MSLPDVRMKISHVVVVVIVANPVLSSLLPAQDRSYGRSVVSTPFGIVASSEVQASQAGARILERGGSAIDAGIAANAVLGVEEPMMNGIGGDLVAIYYDARTGKLTGINASGWAPAGLTMEHLVQPIDITYRGWQVYELPPNGDGFAALEMLNIMEQFDPDPAGPYSPAELHKRIEATKLAYADVKAADGDPDFSKIPVEELTSKAFAKKRASLINPACANCDVAPEALSKSDTTYFTIVHREGNILSMIQSNYSSFGSAVTVRGMGFPLHNRGSAFSLDRNSPNALHGHKRPFHTIIPAFVQKGDRHIGFGIMGGMNQPLAHAQFVSNVVDYGMNIQSALETARFTVSQHGCNILIESRVGLSDIDSLTSKGHILEVRKEYTANMGRGNAVERNDTTKMNFAASDPRADGSAIPEFPADPAHTAPSQVHGKANLPARKSQ
jgi:gamma-glutamyltranspeptidase